jgi:intracellular septation protein A
VSSISYVRPERTRVEKMMAVGLSFNSECVQSMMRRQINMTYSVWKSLNDEEKVFILIFSVF